MDTSPAQPPQFLSPRALRVATMIGAAALFAFGVFAWIAANWADFHRLAKLGLVGVLLLACAAAAILAPRTRAPALLVATAAVGGLLALIGQIYPSGADAWQLFALWTVLALPFAFAARHDAVWVLWTLVASVAIGLWQQQEHYGLAGFEFGQSWTLAIGLALGLSPLAPLRAITGGTEWAFRLASLSAIALVTFTGLFALFDIGAAFLPALVALLAAAVALLRLRPLEFGVLTLVCAGIDTLLIGLLFNIFAANDAQILPVLSLGLLSAGIVGGTVALLRAIHARHAPPRGRADQQGFSWPLAALSGFGALLAAAPFMGVYLLLFGENPSGAFVGGVLTLGAAIAVLRGGAPFGFRQMFGVIAAVVGFLLIGYGVFAAFDGDDGGFIMALVAIIAAAFIPLHWVRALLGFAALLALVWSTVAHAFFSLGLEPVIVTLMAAAGAVALTFVANRTDVLGRWQPFFTGWSAAGLVVLMLLAGRPFLIGGSAIGIFSEVILASANSAMQAVAIALGGAGVALIFWRRPDLRTPLGFVVAAAALALTLRAPALGAAILVFAVAMEVASRSLVSAAVVAIVWIVSTFYYALSWSLTEKAYVLMALGAALGLAIFLTRARNDGSLPQRPRFANAITALIAFGAAATLGGAGASVFGAEQVLRDGRVVYLELRPVDPRSLVQGDYMALAFNTDNLPPPDEIRGTTFALADVDSRSIATLQTLIPTDEQPAPNQIVLRLRAKSGRWFVGSDAFFFEEGTGAAFEAAKHGQFRVGPDGRMLLTGLADENLQSLP